MVYDLDGGEKNNNEPQSLTPTKKRYGYATPTSIVRHRILRSRIPRSSVRDHLGSAVQQHNQHHSTNSHQQHTRPIRKLHSTIRNNRNSRGNTRTTRTPSSSRNRRIRGIPQIPINTNFLFFLFPTTKNKHTHPRR